MMSETVFSNFEPIIEEQPSQNQPQTVVEQEPVIRSKDYQDIRLLTASRFGSSRVFTAKSGNKKVIIKALKPELANDPKCKAALRKEYETTSQLDHKHIRKVLDWVTIQGLGECIVFEYVEGKSLAEHVRVGTLSEKQIKTILLQVCDALAYMHRNQVVHCDLKPENIMVTEGECRAKIIDIGMPRMEYKTNKELLIKEMEFIAPELIKGEDCDARSDIYSMGKIMEFINERNISRQYQAIATHCTQFSKEQRFEDVTELRSAMTKGHSALRVVLVALIVLVVAGIVVYFVPRIKAKADAEKHERVMMDFTHEIERIESQAPALYEKYKLTDLSESISVDWSEDSLAYCESLRPFFAYDSLERVAKEMLMAQKVGLESRRQEDFERLLLGTFKSAQDSAAVALKSALPAPTDSLMMIEAYKWLGQQH